MIDVGFTTLTFVAGWPPTVTVAPVAKSMPVIVKFVPPAGGPEAGLIEKISRCENSDVFPFGSVAVAEMREPLSTVAGRTRSNDALPEPSVVTWAEPRYSSPWRNSCGRLAQAEFEKKSSSYVVDAALFRTPTMCVPLPSARAGPAEVRIG